MEKLVSKNQFQINHASHLKSINIGGSDDVDPG